MNQGKEKRRHLRFMVFLEVKVVTGGQLPSALKLATLDISAGGARCASNVALPEQSSLLLTIRLVGGQLKEPLAIDAEAVVLRCSELRSSNPNWSYEIALEFARLDGQRKKQLQEYLNSL